MAAFTAATGGTHYWDGYSGGSVNATLDTYAISAGSTLTVRTDTNACANHSVAFGSIDTVTFSGQGGTLHFDPTYVRVVAYTGGSGNSPAFGAAISQGGVSGVFLGAWTNWQSECIVPGAAIGATGYIKIGGTTGGEWASGALTGITATCSGASVQGWIECRGADTGTITVPRIGKVTSTEAWFELGTTNGTRGQIIPCPTTATYAGAWAGVWIETSSGSGVYEKYGGLGSVVALATQRTDASMKVITQTTGGIRIGNDGTNGVYYLPPTGCKVRIPAIIWTNCTRNATTGSGPRVLPNATIGTRQEFVTTGAGYLDLRGIVCQWYANFSQAYYVKWKSCTVNDSMVLSEIASPLDVDDCIVAPTQAQSNFALNSSSCFAGGTIQNTVFNRFAMAASGNYVLTMSYLTGVTFSNNIFRSGTLRANASTGVMTATQMVGCTFSGNTHIGGRAYLVGPQNCTFTNTTYYDHTITTTTASTNGVYVYDLAVGGSGNTFSGFPLPLPANGPYAGFVSINACYNTTVQETGTYASPIVLNASVTGVILNGAGNNDGVKMKRCYVSNSRSGPYAFVNSDTNILIENVAGDYADTSVFAGLNGIIKNCGLTGATTGQTSVYGSHWLTRFTSTTAGFTEILCNEPTASSAAQCAITGGTPQFNSSGSVLLTKVGDQVTWEMPFFAIGYTAFTNSAPTITGTNVTYSAGSTWGNHTLEFQVDTGSGYGGTWLALNAATLIGQTFNSTTGYKLKLRATCLTAAAGNVITNMRVAMTTTSTDQSTKLYPLNVVPVTITVKDGATESAIQNARVRITTNVGGYLILEGLTNASGEISGTTEYASHAITGTVRRATAAYGTLYKPGSISGTTTSAGFSSTVLMISDE